MFYLSAVVSLILGLDSGCVERMGAAEAKLDDEGGTVVPFELDLADWLSLKQARIDSSFNVVLDEP